MCLQIFVLLTEKEKISSEQSNKFDASVPHRSISVDSRVLHDSHRSRDSQDSCSATRRVSTGGWEEIDLEDTESVFEEEGDGKSRISRTKGTPYSSVCFLFLWNPMKTPWSIWRVKASVSVDLLSGCLSTPL